MQDLLSSDSQEARQRGNDLAYEWTKTGLFDKREFVEILRAVRLSGYNAGYENAKLFAGVRDDD